jgi:hypothetical protein
VKKSHISTDVQISVALYRCSPAWQWLLQIQLPNLGGIGFVF